MLSVRQRDDMHSVLSDGPGSISQGVNELEGLRLTSWLAAYPSEVDGKAAGAKPTSGPRTSEDLFGPLYRSPL